MSKQTEQSSIMQHADSLAHHKAHQNPQNANLILLSTHNYINRGYYTVARRYEFYVISSRHRVISSIYVTTKLDWSSVGFLIELVLSFVQLQFHVSGHRQFVNMC